MKPKSIIKGAFILTLAGIITKIIGFFYRIYMSNVLGSEGMGLYQLIVPIYMLVWSISSSGISTTISKLTAQENAFKRYGNINKILHHSIIISVFIASILSVTVYLYAEKICIYFIKDMRAVLSLKLICFCFPFMAFGSCIRGWFFGFRETLTPAISQIFEQSIRMATIFFLSGILIPKGVEYAAAAAIMGMCLGEIASFVYVYLAHKYFKKSNNLFSKATMGIRAVYSTILAMAIPLTANRMTGSLLSTIENILIPQKLQESGLSQDMAMAMYGELFGMVMPLVMFPSSILMALATTLLPAVSEASASKNIKRILITLRKTMTFTSIIGIGACGAFITYPNEICELIYNRFELGEMLFFMGVASPFIYLQVTFSGILNGLGEQVFIFKTSLLSSVINIGIIYFIVPKYGVYAFLFGWLISLFIVSLICIIRVVKRTGLTFDFSMWIFKPSFCIACGCVISKVIYSKYLVQMNKFIGMSFAISIVGCFYLAFLIFIGCINLSVIKEMVGDIFRK